MCLAQEYQVLSPDDWVYDVEVIIFGRQLAQPDALTINNRAANLDVPVHALLNELNELPLIKALPQNSTEESTQWQVPLEGEQPEQQALIWVLLQNNFSNPVINKLSSNPTIKPLSYQKWRQPATEFLAAEYVAVTSIAKPEIIIENDTSDDEFNDVGKPQSDFFQPSTQVDMHPDYAFDGVVAYSKQKFDHVTVKMNYYRHDPFGQLISYAIDQKQRIKLGVWQYFDHQQFGVMVKVTAISNEPLNQGE